jgi:hypothetical protein
MPPSTTPHSTTCVVATDSQSQGPFRFRYVILLEANRNPDDLTHANGPAASVRQSPPITANHRRHYFHILGFCGVPWRVLVV